MKRRFKKILALSFSAMLILTGCNQEKKLAVEEVTKKSSIERLANKEEFRFATKSLDGNFDPCAGWGDYGVPLFQSTLLKLNSTKLENDLTTEYKLSDDGLKWTFKIRDDIKFHDGQKLTAKDVAFTYNNTKKLAGRVDLTPLKNAVAIDDTTVEFNMNTPYSAFLYNVANIGIVPEHAYTDSATYSKNPIGSGPFKFVQYDEGQQLILERNDNYYGKKPNFKKYVMLMMDTDSAFAAVKAGDVDMSFSNQSLAKTVPDGYNLKVYNSYDYRVISFPVQKPSEKTQNGYPIGNSVTSDIAIRKALSIGIDRTNIVENALNGYAEKCFDIFSKFPWGLGEEVKDLKDNDKEKAKKILEDAGWKLNSEGVREKDGVKAEFELMYSSTNLDRQAIALAIVEQAKQLGIIINPIGLDWSEIEKKAKETPLVLGGGSYNPMNISGLYNSKFAKVDGWDNVIAYSNEKTDEYIKKAIESTDEKTANEYWKKVLWDGTYGPSVMGENVYLPICYLQHMYFVRDGITVGDDIILPHDHGTGFLAQMANWDYEKK